MKWEKCEREKKRESENRERKTEKKGEREREERERSEKVKIDKELPSLFEYNECTVMFVISPHPSVPCDKITTL